MLRIGDMSGRLALETFAFSAAGGGRIIPAARSRGGPAVRTPWTPDRLVGTKKGRAVARPWPGADPGVSPPRRALINAESPGREGAAVAGQPRAAQRREPNRYCLEPPELYYRLSRRRHLAAS